MKAGISHLGSAGPVLLPCCCTSDSKCSVYLYGFQTNSCWSHGSQTSARWQRAATSLLLDRWCARKRPAYAKCLVRTRSRAAWRRAPGPITAVYVSEMLNRSHLSERCNGGEDERRFVRERNRPADEVFEMRPSRCGNKIKLERQQSMKWLSPNFQDADVIALAVALFQLAAVPYTKAFLPHVLYKPRFSFMDVHDWSCFPLFGMTRNTCYSCIGVKSNIKICLCSHGRKVKDAARQTGTRMTLHQDLFFSYFGAFHWPRFCFSNMSRKWERCIDTEDRHLLTGCWIIIFSHGPPDIDLSALFSCSLILLLLWKTAGLCLGRWTGVGCCSLGKKSTPP